EVKVGVPTTVQTPVIETAAPKVGVPTTAQTPVIETAAPKVDVPTTAQMPVTETAEVKVGVPTTVQTPVIETAAPKVGVPTTVQTPVTETAEVKVGVPTTAQTPVIETAEVKVGVPTTAQTPVIETAEVKVGVPFTTETTTPATVQTVLKQEKSAVKIPQAFPFSPTVVPEAVVPAGANVSELPLSDGLLSRFATLSKEVVFTSATKEIVDTILVSPGLLRSDGEVQIQLRSDVLEGTAIRMVSSGGMLTIQFVASVEKVAALLELNAPQLVERLSSVIHSGRVVVNVRRRTKGDTA
ncbi:MAG: hypothetical protein J6Z49_07980, partial [Kiritimatiellae bacterium]|nr:hypothetical protein [Kiritimatiellia bacterium]